MRRPSRTAAQRAYEKEQRALLVLRQAAVAFALSEDWDSIVLARLEAAAQKYALTLGRKDLRDLARGSQLRLPILRGGPLPLTARSALLAGKGR
jgi:hypothetical protein